MRLLRIHKYGKPLRFLAAGELAVSGRDELLGTLLGSCVAVCLHDRVRGISGMSHFVLPHRISAVDIFPRRPFRYGVRAVGSLLDEMVRTGARREDLEARIFGGGRPLARERDPVTLPEGNVRLARIWLELEDIPVVAADTGGPFTRRLLLDVRSGGVYVRRSRNLAPRRVCAGAAGESFLSGTGGQQT